MLIELRQLIAGLIRSEQTFEVVSHALDQFLGKFPDAASRITRPLQAARDSSLPQQILVALNDEHVAAFQALLVKPAGQCWAQLGPRSKGPMMVVVPSGSGATAPFAIGKYDVSQRDFNVFGKASSQCKVVLASKSRLPTTGVPAQRVEAYAKWLSAAASRA